MRAKTLGLQAPGSGNGIAYDEHRRSRSTARAYAARAGVLGHIRRE